MTASEILERQKGIFRREKGPADPVVMTPEVQIATLRRAVYALMAGHAWAKEAAEHALEISGGR